MAIGLGLMAAKRRHEGVQATSSDDIPDLKRTIVLVALIGAYLVGLELIRFEYNYQFGDIRVGYGSFEVLTVITLTIILVLYWRKPLGHCLSVAVIWSTLLAGAFRYVFTIPLPGSI